MTGANAAEKVAAPRLLPMPSAFALATYLGMSGWRPEGSRPVLGVSDWSYPVPAAYGGGRVWVAVPGSPAHAPAAMIDALRTVAAVERRDRDAVLRDVLACEVTPVASGPDLRTRVEAALSRLAPRLEDEELAPGVALCLAELRAALEGGAL